MSAVADRIARVRRDWPPPRRRRGRPRTPTLPAAELIVFTPNTPEWVAWRRDELIAAAWPPRRPNRHPRRRPDHCRRGGHAYTPANTITMPNGHRACRTCKRESDRACQRRKRERAS